MPPDKDPPFIKPENKVVDKLASTLRGNTSKDLGQDIFGAGIASVGPGSFGGGESVRVELDDAPGFTLSGLEEVDAQRLTEVLNRNESLDLGRDIFGDAIAGVTTESDVAAVVYVELDERGTVSVSVDQI